MAARIDVILGQIEHEILPELWVSDEDLETVKDELRALLQKDHHALEAESHILRTKLARLKDRSQALLDLRLDGEIIKVEFQEKRASLELEEAQAIERLVQVEALVGQGEDDLEQALRLANRLPMGTSG